MATDLRPLGLGELLDRAVTLLVRRFSSIVTAIAVVYVPFAFVQMALVGWLVTPKSHLTRAEGTSLGIDFALAVLIFALERTAAVSVAHAAYMSRSLSLGEAYRLAVARFPAQIVVHIVSALLCVAILIAVAIPVFMIELIAVPGAGIGAAFIAVGIVGALTLFPYAWLYLGYELATVRVATSAEHRYTALFAALRATVLRRPWHSLLVAGALMLVTIGGSLLFSSLTNLMPSPALRALMTFGVGTVGTILIEALTVTFLVVYDVDLAIRREGLDLAVALDAVPPSPA
jgi:hypothetical protein